MLELLNQLDGFSSEDRIKVLGAPLPLPLHAPVFVRVTPV
jgi:ATP-dependent 26S proteasome regulatory subunit